MFLLQWIPCVFLLGALDFLKNQKKSDTINKCMHRRICNNQDKNKNKYSKIQLQARLLILTCAYKINEENKFDDVDCANKSIVEAKLNQTNLFILYINI